MSATQQMLLSEAAAASVTYATLDPANSYASLSFSLGNLRATASVYAEGKARATLSKGSGKWFWEITVGGISGTTSIGLCNSSYASTTDTGLLQSNTNTVGWNDVGPNFTHNSVVKIALGTGFTTGDVIGCALDMSARTMAIYKNGSLLGTGDIGITGDAYPVISVNGPGSYSTVNFGASAFSYSVPSGYNAGLY